MNPELRDPERVMPQDAKAAVVLKAQDVEAHIKAALDGFKELQKLMGQVPTSDLEPEVAAMVADLRVAIMEQVSSLGLHLLTPVVVAALFQKRP